MDPFKGWREKRSKRKLDRIREEARGRIPQLSEHQSLPSTANQSRRESIATIDSAALSDRERYGVKPLSEVVATCAESVVTVTNIASGSTQSYEPRAFLSRMNKTYQEAKKNINDPKARAAMIADALDESEKFISVMSKLTDGEEMNVLEVIPSLWEKGKWRMTPVKVVNDRCEVPIVNMADVPLAREVCKLIEDLFMDRLAAKCEVQGLVLQRSTTLDDLKRGVNIKFYEDRTLASEVKEMAERLVILMVLESVVLKSDESLLDFVTTYPVKEDEYTTGRFVEMASPQVLPITSFVGDGAFATGISTHFDFSCQRICQLRDAIFHANEKKRLESRIDLNAGLHPEIRDTVARDPQGALLQCFAEHHMTRREIMIMMYSVKVGFKVDNQCICCGQPGYTIDMKVHICEMGRWLVRRCQFIKIGDLIGIHEMRFVRPALGKYIEDLMTTRAQQRETLLAKDKAGYSIVKKGANAKVEVVAQIGVRQSAVEAADFQREVKALRDRLGKT